MVPFVKEEKPKIKLEEGMSIDKGQLRELIRDILVESDLHSDSAEELLMLTAAVESHLGTYITQINGPAQGIFQMEPATELDVWDNYLEFRPGREDVVAKYDTVANDDLRWNLAYQIIMARVHYLRVPAELPAADDVDGLANYWKTHYNSKLGKGTVEKAVESYEVYVA